MPFVEQEKVGRGGEIILLDSINELAMQGKVCGKFIDGVYHDAGDKFRYLKAVVDHALVDPKIGKQFEDFLKDRLSCK